MSKRGLAVAALLGAVVVPPALAAPRPRGDGLAMDEAERLCRESGLGGWDLVEHAAQLVSDQFDEHSVWHLWERPSVAMRHGRGWSAQYNAALADLLRRLGFEVEMVHAARVRGLGPSPWWQAGHTWVRVTSDGRTRDVTAARSPSGEGLADFAPATEVRTVRAWTPLTVTAALATVSVYQGWKHMVTREPVPGWMWRELD